MLATPSTLIATFTIRYEAMPLCFQVSFVSNKFDVVIHLCKCD